MTMFHGMLTARAYSLTLPGALREDADRFVQRHQSGSPKPESAPFRRRLDLWVYSLATAVALGLDPVTKDRGYRFKDTKTVEMTPELCSLLTIVAAAHPETDPEELRRDPGEIVRFANRLAAAGCPVVIDRLKELDLRLTPLSKVTRHAEQMLTDLGLGTAEWAPEDDPEGPPAGSPSRS